MDYEIEWYDVEDEDNEAPEGEILMFWCNEANEAMYGVIEDEEVYIYNVDTMGMDLTVSAWAYPVEVEA